MDQARSRHPRAGAAARLAILALLAGRPDGMLFPALRQTCGMTGGNLSRHLAMLRAADLVEIWKGPGTGRSSQTLLRITAPGRKRLAAYLRELGTLTREARRALGARGGRRKGMGEGWRRS